MSNGDEQDNPNPFRDGIEIPEGSYIINFHFEGALAEELRMIQLVDNLRPDELVKVSIENYSLYKAVLAKGCRVVVQDPKTQAVADIVDAFDVFPELAFGEPRADAAQVPDLLFSVIFPPFVRQKIEINADKHNLDFDTYLANSLSFERMVARIKACEFPVIALESPGATSGNILQFA